MFVLWQNALNVRWSAAIMIGTTGGGLFFGLILPHGLLELTAVFVAAGVGLRLGWSWVDPGPTPRPVARARRAAPPARSRSAWSSSCSCPA